MDQFVAEIRIFGCNYAPTSWAQCNGQLMSIAQNTALFSLLGVNFGGNGTTTFGLPDFQGSAGVNMGQAPGLSLYSLGETAGTPTVTLNTSELAVHNHNVNCFNDAGANPDPKANILATSGADSRGNVVYNSGAGGTAIGMNATQIIPAGNGQPHNNMSPYLAVNYCIALQGVYPQRS
ncbi:MAG: phage tail protein [Bacteroidetes bacterium]|nr:phage tail protein [Bacteroidota bacterium]